MFLSQMAPMWWTLLMTMFLLSMYVYVYKRCISMQTSPLTNKMKKFGWLW